MEFGFTYFASDEAIRRQFAEASDGVWLQVDGDELPWRVLVRVARHENGTVVCTGLLVEPGGEREVTTRGLRSIPLASVLERVAAMTRSPEEFPGDAGEAITHMIGVRDAVRSRSGSRGVDLGFYRRVLEEFRRAQAEAPSKPYQHMKDTGRIPGSISSLYRWVRVALELEASGEIGSTKKPTKKATTKKGGKRS